MFFDLQQLSPLDVQHYLQHLVAPRPICFASTINKKGEANLSPFSFFNLFSTQPPVVIFSPSRRLRDGSTKHTLHNVLEVPEVVINIVDYSMVQQTSLASCEYPEGIDEFIKAGFTKAASARVQPPRVAESKAQLECKVLEVKSLGDGPGAGQLVLCEVLCFHVDERWLAAGNKMNALQMQLAARMGGDWYCKTDVHNMFQVAKPNTQLGIGMDALPQAIRTSKVLTGNHLGQLANVHQMPEVDAAFEDGHLKNIVQYFSLNPQDMEWEMHRYAAQLLDDGKVEEAWQVLLSTETML